MSNANEIESEIKIAVGNLLMRADPLSKRVLTKFDPFAKQTINVKSLNSFNLDTLEPCAEFLGVKLADEDSNKLFTKDGLVSRIIFAIKALLPSHCSECTQQYVVDLEPENPPLFTCHMCFQGAHDCETVKKLYSSLSSASLSLLAGHVWLCSRCLLSSSPVKQRRSKSRHNSISKTASALGRIRDQLQGQELESPTAPSSLVIPGFNTPASEPPFGEDTLDRDLQQELDERLQSVSREQVCPKYKSGKCPHGLKGNKVINGQTCELGHPKRCIKYCKFGNKHKHGCNKGNNCTYYHPTICKFSHQSRLCTNENCTFVHLKGTKRKEPDAPPDSRPPKSSSLQLGRQPSGISSGRSEVSFATESDHFLELKQLVLSMQSTFQQEIAAIKSSLHSPHQSFYHQLPPKGIIPLQSHHVPQLQYHNFPQQQPHQVPQQLHQVPPPQMTYIPPSSC